MPIKVTGIPKPVTTSVAVAAAGNYAAGDIVSNDADDTEGLPWSFADVGQKGTIVAATVTCDEDAVVWRLRLHLFSSAPSAATEQDDNAAKTMDNDDRSKYLGYLDFPAMADMGEFSMTQTEAFKGYRTDAGTLYGVLETLDAEANETAGMTIGITLWVTG